MKKFEQKIQLDEEFGLIQNRVSVESWQARRLGWLTCYHELLG